MNCGQARQLLDAWLDGELDSATSAGFAQHVDECPDCASLKADRERLRTAVRTEAPRFVAGPELERAVRDSVRRTAAAGGRAERRPSWRQAIAMACATGVACATATWYVLDRSAAGGPRLRDELVERHVAALGGPLTALASGDRHQVKPWFHGKVPFAPVVCDALPPDFDLVGARVERIAGHPAAAVVYRIRKHPIDVFVWPAADDTARGVEIERARGFAVATWRADGLNFAAVSDVDQRDLERFVRQGCSTP